MKYKSCCGTTCLLMHCEVRDNGGCYCACRAIDRLNTVRNIIEGKTFHNGSVYVVDHEEYFNKLSPEKQKEELDFREKMKAQLPEFERQFKEKFVIKDES